MKRLTLFLVLVSLWGAPMTTNADPAISPVFQETEHCVAYRTTKEMFFFFKAQIIGKNCDVVAALESSSDGDQTRIIASVPVSGFDSNNSARDKDIALLLKGEDHPRIFFRTEWLPTEQLRNAVFTGSLMLPGTIQIAGRAYPAAFPMKIMAGGEGLVIQAQLATTFNAYDLKVPSVGPGGIIADKADRLDILVHLQEVRIEGLGKFLAAVGSDEHSTSGPPPGILVLK